MYMTYKDRLRVYKQHFGRHSLFNFNTESNFQSQAEQIFLTTIRFIFHRKQTTNTE